jgi:hypothetical protein
MILQLYKHCHSSESTEAEASEEEKLLIRPYFDIVTSEGNKVRTS